MYSVFFSINNTDRYRADESSGAGEIREAGCAHADSLGLRS